MYKVIAEFYDLNDSAKHYLPGDTYPREGLTVKPERLEELASGRNRCNHPLIVMAEEPKLPRKRGKKDAD